MGLFRWGKQTIDQWLFCAYINDQTLPFLYASRASLHDQVSFKDLLRHTVFHYRCCSNEVEKKRLEERYESSLKFKTETVKNIRYVKFSVPSKILPYNFEYKGFPTPYNEKMQIYFANGYAIGFKNVSNQWLKIPRRHLYNLKEHLSYGRGGSIECLGKIHSAEKLLQGPHYHRNILYVEVVRYKLVHESGCVVGRWALK